MGLPTKTHVNEIFMDLCRYAKYAPLSVWDFTASDGLPKRKRILWKVDEQPPTYMGVVFLQYVILAIIYKDPDINQPVCDELQLLVFLVTHTHMYLNLFKVLFFYFMQLYALLFYHR